MSGMQSLTNIQDATNPIFGSIDFYDFDRILAGACTGFVVFVILLHLLNHATHLSEPREQVKYELKIPIYIDPVLVTNFSRIMRVALLVPIYSIISLLCISFPTAEVYLRPWLEVAQANCLASYFLLLCEFVSPHTEGRDLFFATIEIRDKRAARKGPVDGVQWFRVSLGITIAPLRWPLTISAAALDWHLPVSHRRIARCNCNMRYPGGRSLLPIRV